jgi:hypothetical protein
MYLEVLRWWLGVPRRWFGFGAGLVDAVCVWLSMILDYLTIVQIC